MGGVPKFPACGLFEVLAVDGEGAALAEGRVRVDLVRDGQTRLVVVLQDHVGAVLCRYYGGGIDQKQEHENPVEMLFHILYRLIFTTFFKRCPVVVGQVCVVRVDIAPYGGMTHSMRSASVFLASVIQEKSPPFHWSRMVRIFALTFSQPVA